MAITSMQTATAGSVANLVPVVKSHISASRFPNGGLVGVKATPTKNRILSGRGCWRCYGYRLRYRSRFRSSSIHRQVQRKDYLRLPASR